MSQASQPKPITNTPGAAAVAAATTKPESKPPDVKPDNKGAEAKTDNKPPDSKPPDSKLDDKQDDKKDDTSDNAEKSKNASKIYVVVGVVHEFETIAKAEKFLNGSDGPADFTVLRGKRFKTSKRVSLR